MTASMVDASAAALAAASDPTTPAHVIRSDAEAIEVAAAMVQRLSAESADRDARRRLPHAELDALSRSGLLGITVPLEHGGAEVSTGTLAEVVRLLAMGDPNIAQIPQSHFTYVNVLRENGSPEQLRFFYAEILAGKRLGNAQAEKGSKTAQDVLTTITPSPDGGFVVDGTKSYCTGALFAHWIPVLAKDSDDKLQVAYVAADAPGVEVVDDWNGMGQRTTASGTVRLRSVPVGWDRVVPHHLTFDRPQLHGALAQLYHTAIDTGIASAALADTGEFLRTRSRPWRESGCDRAVDDPLTLQRFGELEIRHRAAQAMVRAAADEVGAALARLDADSAAAASIAVASAKAFVEPVAIELCSALFELSGTRASLDSDNLHRHWRNARTHTLHDPMRWKVQHVGRYALNGTPPPSNGQN